MFYAEKEIVLKNGKTALLRSPKETDAAEMLEYLKAVSAETEFLLREPEDCMETVEQERKWLAGIVESDTNLMIVCTVDGKVAGNCHLSWKNRKKVRHRASIGIALLKPYWNLGIGTKMFEEMIAVAVEQGISQLELEFVEGNDRAQALYEKMGFQIIGERPNAFHMKDGSVRKEYIMVKQIS